MKFAFVAGRRQEAAPSLKGTCPACECPMDAKCGEVRVWHWAHRRGRPCDRWWEPETEWHRNWKDQFPAEWQEFVQLAESGERHIADVKTDRGWALEFQHSYLNPEERCARDAFYRPRLAWVVNGLRRKRDRAQFERAWNDGVAVGARNSPVRRVFSDECRLLEEWSGSAAPVLFDFGEQGLWWLLANRPNGQAYVGHFLRAEFIEIHRGTAAQGARAFDSLVEDLGKLVANYESQPRARALSRFSPLPPRRRAIRRHPRF